MNSLDHLTEQLYTGTWRDRQIACDLLARLGEADAVHPLVRALDDRDSGVRESAYRALGHLNHPLAINPMVSHLLKETEEEVILAAVKALGQLRASAAVVALSDLLHDDRIPVRRECAKALGEIRNPRALNDLMARVADGDVFVRAEIAEALGRLKSKEAVHSLIWMLGDPGPAVRKNALEALEGLGENNLAEAYKLSFFGPTQDVSGFRGLARNGDIRIVSALLRRLGNSVTKEREKPAIEYVINQIYKPSVVALNRLYCIEHKTRFCKQKKQIKDVGNISFVGCRVCGSTLYCVPATTVGVVLDDDMKKPWEYNNGVLKINWFTEERLFDFNRVIIGKVSDREITKFCLDLGNDPAVDRPTKPQDMVCEVLPSATLNNNSRQILKRLFEGKVV